MTWSRWACVWLFLFFSLHVLVKEKWTGYEEKRRGYNLPGIISDLCKDSPCWIQQWYYCFFHSLFLWFSVYISMPVRFQGHPVHVQYHAWQMGILGMFSWIRRLAQADIWSVCSASAAAADRIFSTISGNGCSQCHSSHCQANTWIVCWML